MTDLCVPQSPPSKAKLLGRCTCRRSSTKAPPSLLRPTQCLTCGPTGAGQVPTAGPWAGTEPLPCQVHEVLQGLVLPLAG